MPFCCIQDVTPASTLLQCRPHAEPLPLLRRLRRPAKRICAVRIEAREKAVVRILRVTGLIRWVHTTPRFDQQPQVVEMTYTGPPARDRRETRVEKDAFAIVL